MLTDAHGFSIRRNLCEFLKCSRLISKLDFQSLKIHQTEFVASLQNFESCSYSFILYIYIFSPTPFPFANELWCILCGGKCKKNWFLIFIFQHQRIECDFLFSPSKLFMFRSWKTEATVSFDVVAREWDNVCLTFCKMALWSWTAESDIVSLVISTENENLIDFYKKMN